MKTLTDFVTQHLNDDVSHLLLHRHKYPETDIDLAVNCIESRRKLKGKVQEWYDNPDLIFPLKVSAEQCSSSATGKYKAELAERIAMRSLGYARDDKEGTGGGWTIADLTGGLGVDSWFFSQKADKVIYNEMQTVLCEAAGHNFSVLGADNIEILNEKVVAGGYLRSLCSVDIVYMDPARRGEGGKKVFLIEDCTPDVLTLKDEISRHVRHILIKLSPMADITMVCERLGKECREIHVVAAGGECKELLVWLDREWNHDPQIIAAELHADAPDGIFEFNVKQVKEGDDRWMELAFSHPRVEGGAHSESGREPMESTAEPTALTLFEPGKALMKAAPFNLIASRFGIRKLGISTHYYVTDDVDKAENLKKYGKVFRIKECMPLDKRSMKDVGKRYPKAEVTARNIPMDTDTLRKKMGITSGDDAHIFGLRSDREGNLLIVAKRF